VLHFPAPPLAVPTHVAVLVALCASPLLPADDESIIPSSPTSGGTLRLSLLLLPLSSRPCGVGLRLLLAPPLARLRRTAASIIRTSSSEAGFIAR